MSRRKGDFTFVMLAGHMFVDAASGDLHLKVSATYVIDKGDVVDEAGLDLDGEPYTNGAPDIGADER